MATAKLSIPQSYMYYTPKPYFNLTTFGCSPVGRFLFTHKGKKKKGKPNYPPLRQDAARRKMPAWRGSRRKLNAWYRDNHIDKRRLARNERRPSNVIHAEHLFARRRWLNQF